MRKIIPAKAAPDPSLKFVERPVPTEKQIDAFEKAVKQEVRREEINDNLEEIYSNRTGDRVDVSHLERHHTFWLVRFFKNLLVIAILASFVYALYYYWSNRPADSADIVLNIAAPTQLISGSEISYNITYHNNGQVALKKMRLELNYPTNLLVETTTGSGQAVIDTTASATSTGNATSTPANYFILPDLPAGGSGQMTVTGRLIGQVGEADLLGATLIYEPANFSSDFQKEMSVATTISSLGFDTSFNYTNAVLVGDTNEIDANIGNVQSTGLDGFDVSFSFPDNITIVSAPANPSPSAANSTATSTVVSSATSSPVLTASSTASSTVSSLLVNKGLGNLSWHVSGLQIGGNYMLPIYYQTTKKVNDNQNLVIRFSKKGPDGQDYIFLEKTIQLNVMNSNLNLTLTVNNSKSDNVANFGETLNYSLAYSNEGDSVLNNVVLMAVIKSDFIDWSGLSSDKTGIVANGTITWTKDQIPELTALAPGTSGIINFNLPLRSFQTTDLGKSTVVNSYAQFSADGISNNRSDSHSNTINTNLNSDLSFQESLRYFDDNNIPVGSGPLPPQVGQTTSIRVYWTLKNDLHDLDNVQGSLVLPADVAYVGNPQTTAGVINFDPTTQTVHWDIGRLPLTTYRADAEFSISLTPVAADRGKILVLSPGASLSATDVQTKAVIVKQNSAETTKLEDDSIAGLNNSGQIQ
jgi:uncharacterized repeat protein (TIGR01451 family)